MRVADIPRLKAQFLKLYDAKLIEPSVFLANVNRLEALERREQKRVLTIAKTVNDRKLAGNEISHATWFANWQSISAAKELLDASS